jgi:hypothetical protein
MSMARVGIFVIPVERFAALQSLSRMAEAAQDELRDDSVLYENRVFQLAEEVARESVIFDGEQFCRAYAALRGLLKEGFLGGEDRRIIASGEIANVAKKMKRLSAEQAREAMARRADKYGEIDWDAAREMYASVRTLVTQKTPEGSAVILADFNEPARTPGPSEADEHEAIPPEELETFKVLADAAFKADQARQFYEDWAEDKSHGSVGLFLVRENDVQSLRDYLSRAEALSEAHRVRDALALKRATYEHAQAIALEHMVLTRHGAVQTLEHTRMYLDRVWPDIRRQHGVYGTAEIGKLAQALETIEQKCGGEDRLAEQIWGEESHWNEELVRVSYQALKDAVRRALKGQCGLVWLFDYTRAAELGGQVS